MEMDQNSSVLQVTLQISQGQSEPEEAKSLARGQWLKLLLVLFVSSFIGTVIGLVLFSHWRSFQAPAPCLSPACLRAAERFSATLDPYSRPCDYFQFTCGATLSRGRQRGKTVSHNLTTVQDTRRWTGRGGGRMDREAETEDVKDVPEKLPDRRTALLQTIKEILESPVGRVSTNTVREKAQRFYNTCMNFKPAESTNSERFLMLVQQLGGWAVSGKWTQPDFNSTLALLMAQYNTFPFFNVYVGPDHREDQNKKGQHYIQIDQPDFQFPIDWNSHSQRSKINTQSLRPFFSSCRQLMTVLDVPLIDTTQHCGLYMSLSSTLVTATSPLTYRLSQKLLYHRITLQELQLLAPAIDWFNCLKAVFHPLPVSQSDFVLLHNLPYIIYMSQTISDWKLKHDMMGSDPLHTYMILTLLQTLLPALDHRFSQILHTVSAEIRKEDIPHWRHCVQQTLTGFDMLLSHVIKENYAHEEAEELMNDIYSTFKTKVINLSWREEESHKLVLNKVKSLTPRLSINTEVLNQLSLSSHYAEVIMSEEDYFSNYLQLLALQQRRRRKLFTNTTQNNMLFVNPFLSGNDIVFPVGLFVSPLFHPSYPRAINYGMLGSVIAKDLLHLLLPDIVSQSAVPSLKSECVWEHYVSWREDSDRDESSLLQLQQQEVWVQYTALEIALQAYHESLQRHSDDTSVSGLSHIHLFLSSFIQASCDSQPYHVYMPFEPSFLVTVLCRNSDLCPKPLICEDKTQKLSPQRC